MPSPEKFRETLDDFNVSQDAIDVMQQGFGKLESKTNKKMHHTTLFNEVINFLSIVQMICGMKNNGEKNTSKRKYLNVIALKDY